MSKAKNAINKLALVIKINKKKQINVEMSKMQYKIKWLWK